MEMHTVCGLYTQQWQVKDMYRYKSPSSRCICSLRLHTFLEAISHVTVVTVRHSLAQFFYSQSSRTVSIFLAHAEYFQAGPAVLRAGGLQ